MVLSADRVDYIWKGAVAGAAASVLLGAKPRATGALVLGGLGAFVGLLARHYAQTQEAIANGTAIRIRTRRATGGVTIGLG